MLLLIGKFVVLLAAYLGGIVLGVLAHELGHAVMAFLVTRQKVELEVGSAGGRAKVSLGRLELCFRTRGLRYGVTRYDRAVESRGKQAWVAVGGPVASVLAVVLFGWLLVNAVVGSWIWILWLGLMVANFRILIVAIWPIEYRPNGTTGEVWVSDGLDLWRLLRSKQG